MNYMGISGIVSHPQYLADKYNILLDQVGIEGMLMQFERFIDTQELLDLIVQTEDNLFENGITPNTHNTNQNKMELTKSELKKLSHTMELLETEVLSITRFNKISGGFAEASLIDYDANIIDVHLKYGFQSDTGSSINEEQYKVCRNTFKII